MPVLKRLDPVKVVGQCMSDCGVSAFEKNLNCDVTLKSKEGLILKAHTVCHSILGV